MSKNDAFWNQDQDTIAACFDEEDDSCPYCGGEGIIEDDCTCGESCCNCLEPDPPECQHCKVPR